MFKELRDEFKKIPTTPKDLKSFGIVMGCFFALVSGVHLLKGKHDILPWAITAAVFFIFAFARPQTLGFLQKPWMMIALILGSIMSRFILSILFLFVITPISLTARLCGKKFLDLRFKTEGDSYWNFRTAKEISKPKEAYEKQF